MLNTCTLGAQGSSGASTKEIQSSLGLVFLPEAQPATGPQEFIATGRPAPRAGTLRAMFWVSWRTPSIRVRRQLMIDSVQLVLTAVLCHARYYRPSS